jgi:hypothetical protein
MRKYDETTFNALLKEIKGSSKNLKSLIQDAAIQAYLAAFGKEDYSPASRLALLVRDDLSKAQFAQLRLWFETFGPFGWRKTEDEAFAALGGFKFRKSNSPDAPAFNPELAAKTNWYEVVLPPGDAEEDKSVNPQTFFRRLEKIISDAERALKEHTLSEPRKNEKEVKALLKALQEKRERS